MSYTSVALKVLIACWCLLSCAPTFAAKITNKDVVELVKGGVPESVIIQAIEAGEPAFETSALAIGELTRSGVSDAIVQRIVVRQFGGGMTAPQRTNDQGAPQRLSDCAFDMTDTTMPIKDGETKVRGTFRKVEKSTSVNMGSVVASVLTFGIVSAKGAAGFGVRGERSQLRLTSTDPVFQEIFVVDDTKTDDMVKLFKFENRDGNRVFDAVTAEQGLLKTGGTSNMSQSMLVKLNRTGKECMGTSKYRGRRFFEVEASPGVQLEPGEYGLLMGDQVLDFGIDPKR